MPSFADGRMQIQLLTGIGRAIGTQTLEVTEIRLKRVGGGTVTRSFSPALEIALDGYTHDLVELTTGANLASFEELSMTLARMVLPNGSAVPGPLTVTASLSTDTVRGRETTLRLLLDTNMFFQQSGSLAFDAAAFQHANLASFGGALPTFFSDLVRIDLGSVASRPLGLEGTAARYLYASGDLWALSGTSVPSLMMFNNVGRTRENVDFSAGSVTVSGRQGSYETAELDPRDSLGVLRRLQGNWADLSEVTRNLGSYAAIAFPSSRPGQPDQLVMLVFNGSGNVTECWIGHADFLAGTFDVYPVVQLGVSLSIAGGGSLTSTGDSGQFQFLFGSRPSGMPSSGTFLRYRR